MSIGISALTTGFVSSMISLDKDGSIQGRVNQPKFYGYIPVDNRRKSRCFILMTLMSTCHNLSRSAGCALLAASGGRTMLLSFVGGEMILYLGWKVARKDFLYWVPVEGPLRGLVSFLARIIVKTIVDFSGCLHFR